MTKKLLLKALDILNVPLDGEFIVVYGPYTDDHVIKFGSDRLTIHSDGSMTLTTSKEIK